MSYKENNLLGKIFVERGYLKQYQVEQVITFSKRSGLRFASAVLELGFCDEHQALECFVEQIGVPAINFSRSTIRINTSIFPYDVAMEKLILPINITDTNILIALTNPFDKVLLDEIAFITGKKVIAYIALKLPLLKAINDIYMGKKKNYYTGELVKSTTTPQEYIDIVAPSVMNFDEEEETEDSYLIVGKLIEEGDDLTSSNDLLNVDVLLKPQKKVLIVDDEPDILKLVSKVVHKLKADSVTVDNGTDALPLIMKHQPDLIILDAMLPGMHGFEICKRIKNSDLAHIPVLIISAIYKGWQFESDIIKLYKADRFLEKPFRINLLMQTIKELLNNQTEDKAENRERNLEEQVREAINLIRKQKFKKAQTLLEDLAKSNPFSFRIKYLLGHIYTLDGKNYLAINELEGALEINRHFFPAAKDLAMIYEKMGFRNKAIEMWQVALDLSEDRTQQEQIKKHLIELVSSTPS